MSQPSQHIQHLKIHQKLIVACSQTFFKNSNMKQTTLYDTQATVCNAPFYATAQQSQRTLWVYDSLRTFRRLLLHALNAMQCRHAGRHRAAAAGVQSRRVSIKYPAVVPSQVRTRARASKLGAAADDFIPQYQQLTTNIQRENVPFAKRKRLRLKF